MKLVFSSIEKILTGGKAQNDHDQIQKRVPKRHLILDQKASSEFLIREMGLLCRFFMLQSRREQPFQKDRIDIVLLVGLQKGEVANRCDK